MQAFVGYAFQQHVRCTQGLQITPTLTYTYTPRHYTNASVPSRNPFELMLVLRLQPQVGVNRSRCSSLLRRVDGSLWLVTQHQQQLKRTFQGFRSPDVMPNSVYLCLSLSKPYVNLYLLELATILGFALTNLVKAKVVCVSKGYELSRCFASICAAVGHLILQNVKPAIMLHPTQQWY